MNIISYIRAYLAILIAKIADDSVENIVSGLSKTTAKLEALATKHAAKIDKFEAQAAAIAAGKLSSEEEIAKAKAVANNIKALLGR